MEATFECFAVSTCERYVEPQLAQMDLRSLADESLRHIQLSPDV